MLDRRRTTVAAFAAAVLVAVGFLSFAAGRATVSGTEIARESRGTMDVSETGGGGTGAETETTVPDVPATDNGGSGPKAETTASDVSPADSRGSGAQTETIPSDLSPCGTPPSSLTGPDWDRDGDGIGDYAELNPTNAEHCLDPDYMDTDPSRSMGEPWEGALPVGLHLADNPSGGGYYHQLGEDAPDTDDWGTAALVTAIEAAGNCWLKLSAETGVRLPRIGVLDLSKRGGGPFLPHGSHQNGLDVDIRYVRNDGREDRLDLTETPTVHDEAGSIDLIDCFVSGPHPVADVFVDTAFYRRFEDWTGGKIRPVYGHHNHFHVRLSEAGKSVMAADRLDPRAGGVTERRGFGAAFGDALSRLVGGDTPQPAERSVQSVQRRPVVQESARISRPSRLSVIDRNLTATGQVPDTIRLMARIAANNAVHLLDPATRRERQVYRAPARAAITELKVAPSEDLVAFFERRARPDATARAALVVLTSAGQPVYRDTTGVHRFTWCCGRSSIVKIDGETVEGGAGFRPTDVSIVDMATHNVRRIELPGPAHDVAWAAHDSTVYIETLLPVNGATVFRYDPTSHRVTPTRHRSVHFSPSGRFYLDFPDERDPVFRVYDAQTEDEIVLADTLGTPERWVHDRGDFLLLVQGRKVRSGERSRRGIALTRYEAVRRIVYDVDARRIVTTLQGDASPWVASRRSLSVTEAGRLRLVRPPRP